MKDTTQWTRSSTIMTQLMIPPLNLPMINKRKPLKSLSLGNKTMQEIENDFATLNKGEKPTNKNVRLQAQEQKTMVVVQGRRASLYYNALSC